MKPNVFIVLAFGALAFTSSVYAQSNAQIIEGALSAAPRRAREGAAVIKWNADYTYTTIKEGTNALVCYDRTDERDRQPFDVQCTSKDEPRQGRAESAVSCGECRRRG